MTDLLSQQDFYDIFQAELETRAPDLTDWVEGSRVDVLGGVFSTGCRELTLLVSDLFKKTYLDSAEGPDENGGGFDDLQFLAVDHYGSLFARPGAKKALTTVAFARANTSAGNVTILAGSIVKTKPDALGKTRRFQTLIDIVMTGTTINADVQAVVAGKDSNVPSGSILDIETALTDPSITVSQSADAAGGTEVMDSATYRDYIRNLIEAIKGATIAAIEAKAKTVAGVATATVLEVEKVVIEWDIGGSTTVGSYFRIPYVTLFIADANGGASGALIAAVRAAVDLVRACGVLINYVAATPFTVNWTAAITLNPSGPNFSTFTNDPAAIIATMKDYLDKLLIGGAFSQSAANAAMLAIWGPAGTNDLTAFTTSVPSGDIAGTSGVKLIAGTVAIGAC